MDSCTVVKQDLAACFEDQMHAMPGWHEVEPEAIEATGDTDSADMLRKLVLVNHLVNFRLWHTEDIARRKDVDAAVIANCKYQVDVLNQRRTDAFEAIDRHLVGRLTAVIPALPEGRAPQYNTESLGMAVDRASILALKIYHMEEQTWRGDADENHRKACAEKLGILKEQRKDLISSVFTLIDDYNSGTKQPKVYFQFKMYNDPSLNPHLYKMK